MHPIPQALHFNYTMNHVHSRHGLSTQNTSEIRYMYTYITQDTTTILQALVSHIISQSPWHTSTRSRKISLTNPLWLPLQSRIQSQTQINSHLVKKLDTCWDPITFTTKRCHNITWSNTCPNTPKDRHKKLQKLNLHVCQAALWEPGFPHGGGEKK